MVMACASAAGSTAALALVAAAHQTGGRVVCILQGPSELQASKDALGHHANRVEFVAGNARTLLLNDFRGADFVLIDCDINDHKGVFVAAQKGATGHVGALIVAYNALHKRSWPGSELRAAKAHFLPIGEGLLVSRSTNIGQKKSHRWVVKVDKCTGEEHVFRITSPNKRQWIEA